MVAVLCRFDLHIPAVRSLKEKRHVIKALKASIRSKFNVSVAEVEHQDLWQRAAIGVSAVSADGYSGKRVIHQVERHIGTFPSVEVIDVAVSLHGPEDS